LSSLRQKITKYGEITAAVSGSKNLMEILLILVLVGCSAFSALNPITIYDTPIFFTEAFLFPIFAYTSRRQLILAFAAFSLAIFLVHPYEFPVWVTLGIFILLANSVRFVTSRYEIGTLTEGLIASYLVILPVLAVMWFWRYGDVSLTMLQLSRKVADALICIFLFHVVDKVAIAINSSFNSPIPLFPATISTREFVQSLTAASLSAVFMIVVTFQLSQIHSNLDLAIDGAVAESRNAHSEQMHRKFDRLIATRNQGKQSNTETPVQARYIRSISERGTSQQNEIVKVLLELSPTESPSAVIERKEGNSSFWDFYTNLGPPGILYLSFRSQADLTSFFSADGFIVELSQDGIDDYLPSAKIEAISSEGNKKKVFNIYKSDSASLQIISRHYLGENYLLSALSTGNSFLTYSTQSSVQYEGRQWAFITCIDAWPLLQKQYLPFVLVMGFGFLILCFFIVLLGTLVTRALYPSRAFSQDYSAYVQSLLESDPSYEPPKVRTSMLEETVTTQNSFNAIAKQIATMHAVMQDNIASYRHFFDEIPVGIMGVDESGKENFVNEGLAAICKLSSTALDEILAIALDLDSADGSNGGTDAEVMCGDGRTHQLTLVKVDRLGRNSKKEGYWIIVDDRTDSNVKDMQLAQASKLATLGQMSTEIAHELNQPLNVLALCQASITSEVGKAAVDTDKILKKTARMKSAVDRASRIINHMRVYGRVDTGKMQLIDARQAISGSLTMMEDQLKILGLVIHKELPESELIVMSDITKLEQVIINLLSNSRDAALENSLDPIIKISARSESGQVKIVVQDNGGGVDEADIFKIFEPFWTTKLSGEGTGLGGSISYGVIKEMGGTIVADNFEGGLRVIITLKEFRGELALSKSAHD